MATNAQLRRTACIGRQRRRRLVAGKPRRHVRDLLVIQHLRHDAHHLVFTRPFPERRQLRRDISCWLAADMWRDRNLRQTVNLVTGPALARHLPARFPVACHRLGGQNRPGEENPAEDESYNGSHSP